MYLNKKKKRPAKPIETEFERTQREHKQAVQLAQQFKDIKPTKYVLK